jgi:hypothetical protein
MPVDLRLAAVLGVSALVLAAMYRWARGANGGDPITAAMDALLGFYLLQYVAVGVTGLIGVLNAPTILLVVLGATALIWLASFARARCHSECTHEESRADVRSKIPREYARDDVLIVSRSAHARWLLPACIIVVISYLAALTWLQRAFPPTANDPLTYHLPAAVEWIQRGRITLFQAWLFNPANTYSPLAGSVFLTWLVAPMGSDVLARFAQMPALMLIFFAFIELCRGADSRGGLRRAGGSVLIFATALVLSRPFLSQTILEKDDLFVTAFFTTAMAGLTSARLREALGPLRVGVAIGLMLATKYTALLSLPLVLLAFDAPAKAGWRARHWLIGVLAVILLAGPWFLRNAILTGNPLYPVRLPMLPGLFVTARSHNLCSFQGVGRALAGGYYSPPYVLWGFMMAGWLSLAVRRGAPAVMSEPHLRAVIAGPVLGIGLFLFTSPYDEVRFIYPSLVLLAAATCTALADVPAVASWIGATLILGVSLATNFILPAQAEILPVAAIVGATCACAVVLWSLTIQRLARLGLLALTGAAFVAVLYVQARALVANYRFMVNRTWQERDPPGYSYLADGWAFVREELPPGETVAYANTYFVYPLYGFELDRPVVYATLREGLNQVHDLPVIGVPLSGEQIVPAIVRATVAEPDRDAWLKNLRTRGAKYLFVAKHDLTGTADPAPPAELSFAEQDAIHFQRLFDNQAAAVYQIRF